MAGVLDLKGKFVSKINKSRATPQMTLYVETKAIMIAERLSQLTGVAPGLKEPKPISEFMRRGCDVHCPAPHVHVNNLIDKNGDDLEMPRLSRWTITGAGIVVIVHNVAPYLCEENRTSFLAVAEDVRLYTPLAGQGSGAVVSAVRRLAILGWKLPDGYESVMD